VQDNAISAAEITPQFSGQRLQRFTSEICWKKWQGRKLPYMVRCIVRCIIITGRCLLLLLFLLLK